MNKNSNTYIIIYTVVMVVLVAVLLSVTSLSLQPLQKANELGAKQKAILEAMNVEGVYDSLVTEYVVNAEGDKIQDGGALTMLDNLNAEFAAGNYPVFENKQTGVVVVPMRGKGLWNDIWGYIALDTDKNTIKGIVLDHAGETPGLGAEIKEEKFEKMFIDKKIYNEATIEFKVVKGGAGDAINAVDAISGATKTCDGVTNMLNTCLSYYDAYFQKSKGECPASVEVNTPCGQPCCQGKEVCDTICPKPCVGNEACQAPCPKPCETNEACQTPCAQPCETKATCAQPCEMKAECETPCNKPCAKTENTESQN